MSARALLAGLLLLAQPAWAHRLQLELFPEPAGLRCELFFSDGNTPEGAELILFRLDGAEALELERAASDAQGVARFALERSGRYRVEARDASLHLASEELELELPEADPAPVASPTSTAPTPPPAARGERPWGGIALGVLVIALLAGGLHLWQARRRP